MNEPKPNQQDQPLKMPLFLGAITELRQNWMGFVAQPKTSQQKADQDEKAAHLPITAYLYSVAVLDRDGQPVFLARRQPTAPEDSVAVELVQWLDAYSNLLVPHPPAEHHVAYDGVGCTIYGIDCRSVLQVAAVGAMRAAATSGRSIRVNPGIWYCPVFSASAFGDPYEMLVPKGLRNHIDLRALAEFLGVTAPLSINVSATDQAELVRQLALRGQFFDPADYGDR